MKLSEAIRLNSVMTAQGWEWNSIVSRTTPCALGGALQSVGQQPKKKVQVLDLLRETWPFICDPIKCPCGSDHQEGEDLPMFVVIMALNDNHGWTRNQIADWVETVEPAEPSTAAPEQEVEQLEKKGA